VICWDVSVFAVDADLLDVVALSCFLFVLCLLT
jgi:hypothetical protein